jgi:hypothetical protein
VSRLSRVLAVAGVLLLLAGCGGLDEHGTKAAHSLSRSLQDSGLTAKDADCIATKWVEKAGVDRLRKDGVVDASYGVPKDNKTKPSRPTVEAYADARFDCDAYGKVEALTFDQNRPGLIDKQGFAACADRIDRDDAKQALVDNLLGKSSKVADDVQHRLLTCATSNPGEGNGLS